MEVFYQVSLQIILLLLTRTKTATTAGLQTFFKQESFLGIEMSATVVLGLSILWSLKTCIFLHMKSIRYVDMTKINGIVNKK